MRTNYPVPLCPSESTLSTLITKLRLLLPAQNQSLTFLVYHLSILSLHRYAINYTQIIVC
jgi:hypothetical protein